MDVIIDDRSDAVGVFQGRSHRSRQCDLEGLIPFDLTIPGDDHRDFASSLTCRDDQGADSRDVIDSGCRTERGGHPLAAHRMVR